MHKLVSFKEDCQGTQLSMQGIADVETGIKYQTHNKGLFEDTVKKKNAVSYLVQIPLKKKRA